MWCDAIARQGLLVYICDLGRMLQEGSRCDQIRINTDFSRLSDRTCTNNALLRQSVVIGERVSFVQVTRAVLQLAE
jgi:hypothetical protein